MVIPFFISCTLLFAQQNHTNGDWSNGSSPAVSISEKEPLFFDGEQPKQSPVVIRLIDDENNVNHGTIEIIGFNAELLLSIADKKLSRSEWQKLFSVHVCGESEKEETQKPALLGSYKIDEQNTSLHSPLSSC